ncbi:ERF family protein (plasmid) [Borreliella sinica]|uniref:ERF family protein n=1 Tax=Borreliella sinica TaxID=87162 RepID=UPI003AEFB96B
MTKVSKNNNFNIQDNIPNNIQAKIKFRKDMKTLKMNLPRIDKSLQGHKYMYQDFNDILEEIENVIEKHNLELDFEQYPIYIEGQYGIFDCIRTTFYSTSTDYEFSFDTRIHIDGAKTINTLPQQVGSAITYFKRYALVACLRIKSEVDTDAAPIYNNDENRNSVSNRQVSVNQKQEKKQDINQNQNFNKKLKIGKSYCYEIFRNALFNIKNWVNEDTEKSNINALIRALCVDNDDVLDNIFEKNSELKSIEYWVKILKEYFKKNNKLDDLNKFEKFMSDKKSDYETSVLKFFCMLKEERQFDYMFAL